MKVFIDYMGHSDVHYGFHCLFEKRIKASLFRTYGVQWIQRGFLNPGEDTAERRRPEDQVVDGVYHIPMKMEPEGGYYTQKAVTFGQFLKMDFDVAVASYWGNEKLLYDILRKHKPNTLFIRWIGNLREKPLGFAKNILLATYEPMPPGFNCIIHHPEHYEGYCYVPPTNHKSITNFANNFSSYPQDVKTWNECLASPSLKDFYFKVHGHNGSDGPIPHLLMPQAMKDPAFVWHVKAHGGGGFVARQALACGRPCIVKKKYAVQYNTLAKNLFVDSVNCVDLDLGVKRGIKMIREWSQPDRHIEVCKATAEKFKRDVDFAGEAERVKEWINGLLRR